MDVDETTIEPDVNESPSQLGDDEQPGERFWCFGSVG